MNAIVRGFGSFRELNFCCKIIKAFIELCAAQKEEKISISVQIYSRFRCLFSGIRWNNIKIEGIQSTIGLVFSLIIQRHSAGGLIELALSFRIEFYFIQTHWLPSSVITNCELRDHLRAYRYLFVAGAKERRSFCQQRDEE